MAKSKMTYKAAGVDIDAGEESVRRISSMVTSTFNAGVLQEIGHFGAMFQVPAGYKEPVLVSSVDGVGTKLKVAVMMRKHDTIGADLVNHCVDDVLTTGAKPLYFLDYLSLGKVEPTIVEQIISGMVRGCKEAQCALIGGETAEMTDLYQPGDYDLAGTIVGIVEKTNIINGAEIRAGDQLLGLKSSGLHTNGYTLARKIFFERHKYDVDTFIPDLNSTVGAALLAVHRNYYPVIAPILEKYKIHGLAHITGGGIEGNTKRVLPQNTKLVIDWSAWEWLPVFRVLQELGDVPVEDMRRTFNLGIGFVLIVSPNDVEKLQADLKQMGEQGVRIGEVVNAG
jgi:phosphoribosylformylglycinamidine cyclo-ligase